MPLGHLIALISNAHLRKLDDTRALEARVAFLLLLGTVNTAYRKTSCIEINPNEGLRLASQRSRHTRPAHTTTSVADPISMRQDQRGALSALHASGVSLLHDVKIAPPLAERRNCYSSLLGRSARRLPPAVWWSQTGSNRRPPACKAGALPTELWPLQVTEARNQDQAGHVAFSIFRPPLRSRHPTSGHRSWHWWAWKDLNFRPHAYQARALTN